MRQSLAIVLAPLFLVLLLVAITVNQVVNTVANPDTVIGIVNDAEAYDYLYDNIVGNLVSDLSDRGLEVGSGFGDSTDTNILRFEDPEVAASTINDLVETMLPREYVREKFEQSLKSVVPYMTGETDEFTIDLEIQERIRTLPEVARVAVTDLNLTERVIDDLIVPQVAELSGDVFTGALGISFTPEEIEDITRLIFAPEWIEDQLFGLIDEVTPYFAGDADSFNVTIRFDGRVAVVGQILKDKLNSEDTLYTLVFTQVIDPLIQQTVAQSTSVGFGVELTEQEVIDTFEIIAPREWVRELGDGVIDSVVEYLNGSASTLHYTVDLSQRKIAATEELQSLARRKLESTLGAIPGCISSAQAIDATQDIAAGRLPVCIAGGQSTVAIVVATFGPLIDEQVASFVSSQVPDQIAYSQADFEAQVGSGFDVVTDARSTIAEGVSFSDQDLIDAMSDENDPSSRADAEDSLRILADRVLLTEKDITDNLDADALKQFNDARGYVNTGLSLKWLIWVLLLLVLAVISFIGGRTYADKLKWAGAIAAISGVVIYSTIAVGWTLSLSGLVSDQIPVFDSFDTETRTDFPRLTAELESGEAQHRLEAAIGSWQSGWRNQTIPWIGFGLLAFAVGAFWPRFKTRQTGRSDRGSGTSSSESPHPTAPLVTPVSARVGAGTRLGRPDGTPKP
ncbi:MAG: hypothetical protein O3B95_09200 [Chloroflexi bacterium]|nr:hypothetical protein [Chloroflexota bacterium]